MAHAALIDRRDLSTLAAKVAFLAGPEAYADRPASVELRETHMSCVFLTPDRVYKLKKPVRFPYLDFSTVARREAACRAELKLNRRLARDVYLEIVPLVATARGLTLGPAGAGAPGARHEVVDWLVVMRRLDQARMLDHLLAAGRLGGADLARAAAMLAMFFRGCDRTTISRAAHLEAWRQSLAYNRRVLLDSRLGLPGGLVRSIDRVQRRFLAECGDLLRARVRARAIVDGHGDLRPEHIFLGEPPCAIDCLEFNAVLRANDPFDEIAFLALECARLGDRAAGERLGALMRRLLPHPPPAPLFVFYRGHRAMLRARLAIAHLLEDNPRTPAKWRALARTYLAFAAADARRLEGYLRVSRRRLGRLTPR